MYTITGYSWYVNSVLVGTTSTLSYQFTTTGWHTIRLVVTDDDSNTAERTIKIFINIINTFTWAIFSPTGEEQNYTQNSLPVIFTTEGFHTVTLSALGYLQSSSRSLKLYINKSRSYTYDWNFDDNSNSSLSNPTHTFSTKSIYNVTLRVTDNFGSISSITRKIFNYIINKLTFGDGTSYCGNNSIISHTYVVVGNFTVQLWQDDVLIYTLPNQISIGQYAYGQLMAQVQPSTTYVEDYMKLLPLLKGRVNKEYNLPPDQSIYGEGYQSIPHYSGYEVKSSLSINFDTLIFNGMINKSVFSVCQLNNANVCKFTSVVLSGLKLTGANNQLWKINFEMIMGNFQRLEKENIPVYQEIADSSVSFHDSIFWIGDTEDPLGSSDAIQIESFTLDIDNDCTSIIDNTGLVNPTYCGLSHQISFTLSRHNTDQFLDWQDSRTILQLRFNIGTVYYRAPRCICIVDQGDSNQTVTLRLGRNGINGQYKNTFMENHNPIHVEVS